MWVEDEHDEDLSEYTPEIRLQFCKLAKGRCRYGKYNHTGVFNEPEDFIVKDTVTLSLIDAVLSRKECPFEDFLVIYNRLTAEQINHIAFTTVMPKYMSIFD